jgi:hypothetical protein
MGQSADQPVLLDAPANEIHNQAVFAIVSFTRRI